MTEDLRSCPFCGSPPEVSGGDGWDHWIGCRNGNCLVTPFASSFANFEDVRSIWNTRTPSAREARLEEALKPFAAVAENDIGESEADADVFRSNGSRHSRAPAITVGDLRRARLSLESRDDE